MIVTAFVIGLLGSWHCAGMCCPLTMMVNRNRSWIHRILYNSSRILVYAFIGLLAASTGSLPILQSFHTPITLLFGGLFLIAGLSILFGSNQRRYFQIDSAITRLVHKVFGQWIKRKSIFTPVVLGAMNGLLPCGLTYLAITYCFVLTPPEGFYFMLFFGFGTWPVMLGWESLAKFLSHYISYQKIKIALFLIAGLTLVGRGLIMKMDNGHVTISTVTTVCQ